MPKASVYLGDGSYEEAKAEARRTGRNLSWIVCRAWRIARREIKAMPSAADLENQARAAVQRTEARL
jgi:uncharacterized small protein (TIGR04563 family)